MCAWGGAVGNIYSAAGETNICCLSSISSAGSFKWVARSKRVRRMFFILFSSRWYLCARKSPYAPHPVSQTFPQRCLWNGFNVCLIDDGSLSSVLVFILLRKTRHSVLFLSRLADNTEHWARTTSSTHAGQNTNRTFHTWRSTRSNCSFSCLN